MNVRKHQDGAIAASPESSAAFHRSARNLLVTGHRANRAFPDEATRQHVRLALEAVTAAVAAQAVRDGAGLRIVTGYADGSDEMAAATAAALALPLHIIAPCRPAEVGDAFRGARGVTLMESASGAPPEAWIAASDEAKLALADAMVVIWDGNPPAGSVGGAVRLLIEALHCFTPVIWIDARAASAGTVRVFDSGALDPSALAMLKADEASIQRLQGAFRDAGPAAGLDAALGTLLAPFWSRAQLAGPLRVLEQAGTDPGDGKTFAGMVHTNFLALFGPIKRKRYAAVGAWRGPAAFWNPGAAADGGREPGIGMDQMAWRWFDRLDRVATHAANQHRDQVVAVHLLSCLAVLGAVAGAIDWLSAGAVFWGLFELATLAGIGLVLVRDQRRMLKAHGAWLHFRQAAEALRLSALLHPALASLRPLYRGIWRSTGAAAPPTLVKPYHWLVIQLLRETGLRDADAYCVQASSAPLVEGLAALVDDQRAYHHGKHASHHHVHHWLHRSTNAVFFLVLGAVAAHLFALGMHHLEHHGSEVPAWCAAAAHWIHEQRWLLLVTAFFPALAAALHATTTKLELQRVARNSETMLDRLDVLKQAVAALRPGDSPLVWRALAIETAATMYAEHDAWANLMEVQELDIPA